MSLSGLPSASAVTSPAVTPPIASTSTSASTSASASASVSISISLSASASASATNPKRRIRAPPPKNCSCEWCGATFTKSGLGRHYDQWVYAASPARPDEKHTEEAIVRMRELRSDVRRLREMKHMDPKEKKSLQNRRNYERHQEQQVEKKRVKRIADMARSMVLKELAKEVDEIQASPPPTTTTTFTPLTPVSPLATLNFATLAYHFLPPPPTLLHSLPLSCNGTWNIAYPDIHEYTALYSLFRHSPPPARGGSFPGTEWLHRLNAEWARWQPLSDPEKARSAMLESCRAHARKHDECERLKAYAALWADGRSLAERARKWEGRAALLREVHGRAEEVALTGELDRMWEGREGCVRAEEEGGGGFGRAGDGMSMEEEEEEEEGGKDADVGFE